MQLEFEYPRFWIDIAGREIETGRDEVRVTIAPDMTVGGHDYYFSAVDVYGAPTGGRDGWHEIPLKSYAARSVMKYAREQMSEQLAELWQDFLISAADTRGDAIEKLAREELGDHG